jgi:uncharacterized protein YecE (DUF72 family)
MARGKLYVGTSGWSYRDWRGRFYPAAMPQKRWLNYYADRFWTTEINASFYRTPSVEAVQNWRDQTPEKFRFAWKGSKFITHWKRLSENSENSIELMRSRLVLLGPKCGMVLFQLPARFTADLNRLQRFLSMLPNTYDYAFEFRHKSWYEPPVLDLLHKSRVALCVSDHRDAPAPWIATSSKVYVRGHGPKGDYRGNYPERTLRALADQTMIWQDSGKTVYVYFDNDQKSAAPHDAERLQEMCA